MSETIHALAYLEPFEGREEELLRLLQEFYDCMRVKHYSHDLLFRNAKNDRHFIHLRRWESAAARELAVHDPEVQGFWRRLSAICEINTTYESLDPIYCSFPEKES